jgi:tripartite-type tricarboxylate transporter receptor subunit TctC
MTPARVLHPMNVPFAPPDRRRRALLGASFAAGLVPGFARAQPFPSRPIRLMVGFAPGGGVDAMARLVAQGLSAQLGQPVVVENRAGAAGMIAAEAAAQAPADGHTLWVGESGALINRHLQPRPGVDPVTSFTPVAGLVVSPMMIVAHPAFPARDPKELVAALKARPGAYTYGTPGVGTVQHLGFELLKARTASFVVHIPYRGAALVLPDVASGQIQIGVVSATAAIAQVAAGRVRGLAMMSPATLPGAESVRPLAEALPGFDVAARIRLMAPAGTPAPVVARLAEATRAALAQAETARAIEKQGGLPAWLGPAELGAELASESASWEQVIRSRGIRPE